MFETLFHHPRVLSRHRDGPSAEERKQFLVHRAHLGGTRASLLHLASDLLVVARRINLRCAERITVQEIDAAADRWVHYQRHHHRISDSRYCRQRFVRVAAAWLLFLGRLTKPLETPRVGANLVEEFANYMRLERGLSSSTILTRCWHVQAFLNWLSEKGWAIDKVSLEQVDAFLAFRSAQGLCRVSIANAASALRSFFVYLSAQGRCSEHFAAGIEGPRIFKHEGLPVGVRWEDVRQLIVNADTDRPKDIRDRAIMMLLAVYGLRCAEVLGLSLDDIDWEQEILHVSRPKQRCAQNYPLTTDVGNAILRYLKDVRQRSASRALFLSVKAPVHPLSPGGVYNLVTTRMRALNIRCRHRGPHALRHACAANLMAQGLSLKQIGDHLGHRSSDATRNYAKVDLVGLRQVADFELAVLL